MAVDRGGWPASILAFGAALLAAACSSKSTPSPATCTDTTASDTDCGACGHACGQTQHCADSACVDNPITLVTSAPDGYWQTGGQVTEVSGDGGEATADVTVDDTSTAQTWEGFGGAFNEMGWSYLSMLSQADRNTAISLLYGANGARFTLGRIPIGASDYAMDRYTDDEVGSGDTDPSLASFSIARDRMKLIPYIRAAQAVNANIRFWASPWTPPTWMKQGPFAAGNLVTPFDGGTIKTDDATMDALAQYLIRFVQAYAQQGITIETISAQNEPSYIGTYPTCGWSAAPYTTFIGQHLGPAIASAGLTTKIMLGTFNDGTNDPATVSAVMGDSAAAGYVKVFGFQWGLGGTVSHVQQYNLPVWQTEHQCGNYPWATPFNPDMAPNDQAYAVESWGLIRDWIRAGVTAYSAWNMVLDTVGVGIDSSRVWPQNALLTVDTAQRKLNITPTYYVFRHLSAFVEPGATVIAARGGDALAFKNPDGSTVVVLYNSGDAKTTTVAMAGKQLQFAMPGNGWATLVAR